MTVGDAFVARPPRPPDVIVSPWRARHCYDREVRAGWGQQETVGQTFHQYARRNMPLSGEAGIRGRVSLI